MRKSKSAYAADLRSRTVMFRGKRTPPPPMVEIEAKKAKALAATVDPLALILGDPLPGRSALDKIKKGIRP